MQLKPVATATPDGKTVIARRYRWIPALVLMEIERIEQRHRELPIRTLEMFEEMERDRLEAQPYQGSGRHPVTVSSRRAVMLEYGYYGSRRLDAESRSHSRAKEPLKNARRSGLRDLFCP